MNLFLRIVLVWFKAFFKPRIGVLDPYETVSPSGGRTRTPCVTSPTAASSRSPMCA